MQSEREPRDRRAGEERPVKGAERGPWMRM